MGPASTGKTANGFNEKTIPYFDGWLSYRGRSSGVWRS